MDERTVQEMSASTVIPIPGETGRFWCVSRTRQGIRHLVDLTEKPFQCSCEYFSFQLSREIREDRAAGRKVRRYCHHITEVLIHVGETAARMMREQELTKTKVTHHTDERGQSKSVGCVLRKSVNSGKRTILRSSRK